MSRCDTPVFPKYNSREDPANHGSNCPVYTIQKITTQQGGDFLGGLEEIRSSCVAGALPGEQQSTGLLQIMVRISPRECHTKKVTTLLGGDFFGGLEEIRTPDPHNANVVRSQLRYEPILQALCPAPIYCTTTFPEVKFFLLKFPDPHVTELHVFQSATAAEHIYYTSASTHLSILISTKNHLHFLWNIPSCKNAFSRLS